MHNDRAYTLEEIHKVLDSCDERTKVIVLLMASTGMRIGAIPGLKVGHLTPVPSSPSYNLYKIHVYATSRKDHYTTYCTPECRTAIDNYLDLRRRQGETIQDKSPPYPRTVQL